MELVWEKKITVQQYGLLIENISKSWSFELFYLGKCFRNAYFQFSCILGIMTPYSFFSFPFNMDTCAPFMIMSILSGLTELILKDFRAQ